MSHYIIILLFGIILLGGCTREVENKVSASGTIETTEVTVSSKLGGQVVAMLVDEGVAVRPGDTLAVIDRSDLEIQLAQAQANLAVAEAQYKLAVRGARSEDVAQAEASFRNAENDLERMEELFRAQSITRKQLDDARTRYIVAEQHYEKFKKGSRPEEIETARARREQAATQLQAIEKKIADTYVVAPIAGVVTQRIVERGEEVFSGSSMFRISRLEEVNLIIYVSAEELARVKLGQQALVYIDALPAKPFPGTVTYISPAAEFTPKNIQTKDDRTKLVFGVKIAIPNPDQVLKPGLPADAVVQTES